MTSECTEGSTVTSPGSTPIYSEPLPECERRKKEEDGVPGGQDEVQPPQPRHQPSRPRDHPAENPARLQGIPHSLTHPAGGIRTRTVEQPVCREFIELQNTVVLFIFGNCLPFSVVSNDNLISPFTATQLCSVVFLHV